MSKASTLDFIDSTAGQLAAELARRGVAPDQRVTVTIEPNDWIAETRRAARPQVVADGLTDKKIDQLIKQAQKEVEPRLG